MSQAEIAAVINLYAVALDSRSWDLFDTIFTADVEADYPTPLHWHDLASFKRDFIQMHEATAGHQHHIGPPQIIVEGDRAFAFTYCRYNVIRVSPAKGPGDMSEGGAWYDDELVRTAAGWRIRKRTARNFWRRGSLPEEGDVVRVIDSLPELAKAGRVAYLEALKRQR